MKGSFESGQHIIIVSLDKLNPSEINGKLDFTSFQGILNASLLLKKVSIEHRK